MLGPIPVDDPFTGAPLPLRPTNARSLERWQEHQRRQRSLRFLLMFLMMLILMDGDDPKNRQMTQKQREANYLRHSSRYGGGNHSKVMEAEDYLRGLDIVLTPDLYRDRRMLDRNIRRNVLGHSRLEKLIEKNKGVDQEAIVYQWVEANWNKTTNSSHDDEALDAVTADTTKSKEPSTTTNSKDNTNDNDGNEDKDGSKTVYHYPTNATGYYRGRWNNFDNDDKGHIKMKPSNQDGAESKAHNSEIDYLETEEVMMFAQRRDSSYKNGVGVILLSKEEEQRLLGNVTSGEGSATQDQLTITRDSGRIILHLYSREVPGMKEISLLDGFIKICDVSNSGFSSPKRHIFLRVRGVIIPSIGRISLVANDEYQHSSALTLVDEDSVGVTKKERYQETSRDDDNANHSASHRHLKEAITGTLYSLDENSDSIEKVRDDVLERFSDSWDKNQVGGASWNSHFHVSDGHHRRLEEEYYDEILSSLAMPHPYAPDDDKESLKKIPSVITKGSPPEALLDYSKHCEFEINMDVKESQWTIKQWRLLAEKMKQRVTNLDPTYNGTISPETNLTALIHSEEALISNLVGLVVSPNCDVSMMINVTAIRTDWEQMTCKAINYCFFMMLASLTQIVVLLRQLLHTQSQSSAVRVSIICIGWQALIDAISCITHILFCIMLQPVFSAFAMVAFFKLLIFCVIEMKYMVIIMQARNNARNVPSSSEEVRRRVAMLHIRFYGCLVLLLMFAFKVGEDHRTACMLMMYSFWLPQIIRNIITETKKPMHKYYIYGMSATRLVAPLYMFSMPRNFLTEIDPEFPIDHFTCQMLVVWTCIQVAILISQDKYGARFMIPARCLPPKYDYHRPVPDSLLPTITTPSQNTGSDLESAGNSLMTNDTLPESSVGPRNRKEKRSTRSTAEDSNGSTTVENATIPRKCLDCVICYNDIDIENRKSYMLAPCGHIFHQECLEQWMEVKMECPVCRMELPAL